MILKIFLSVVTLLSVSFSSLEGANLNWEHNYDKALVTAKKEHKDVYVFIGADVCKFCDRFKETLKDQALMQKIKEDYVPVYLSRDQHHVPKQFGTAGVPKHYFVTAEGEIFYYTWGSRDVAGFYTELDEADLRR